MATPNADRLHGIEDWRTSAIEDSFRLFSSVKSSLTEIAAINRGQRRLQDPRWDRHGLVRGRRQSPKDH